MPYRPSIRQPSKMVRGDDLSSPSPLRLKTVEPVPAADIENRFTLDPILENDVCLVLQVFQGGHSRRNKPTTQIDRMIPRQIANLLFDFQTVIFPSLSKSQPDPVSPRRYEEAEAMCPTRHIGLNEPPSSYLPLTAAEAGRHESFRSLPSNPYPRQRSVRSSCHRPVGSAQSSPAGVERRVGGSQTQS